jgi:hypothetical protein
MTVSSVCSYSFNRRDSCLFSWCSVWFSMIVCAFARSVSDSNVSADGRHQLLYPTHATKRRTPLDRSTLYRRKEKPVAVSFASPYARV